MPASNSARSASMARKRALHVRNPEPYNLSSSTKATAETQARAEATAPSRGDVSTCPLNMRLGPPAVPSRIPRTFAPVLDLLPLHLELCRERLA
jgi:hypothetical protein